MLTRSQKIKQHIYLTISEKANTHKKALRKRHPDNAWKSVKKRYSSKGNNLIVV